MIEEILTDHREHKASAPVGDFLKFGVHALLSARPLHNQLGKRAEAQRLYLHPLHLLNLHFYASLFQFTRNQRPPAPSGTWLHEELSESSGAALGHLRDKSLQ